MQSPPPARKEKGRLRAGQVGRELACCQRQIRVAQRMPPTARPTTSVLSRSARVSPWARSASTMGPKPTSVRGLLLIVWD